MSTTENLTRILRKTHPEDMDAFLKENSEHMIDSDKPFASYMKQILKRNGVLQTEAFIYADIPEHYGYRILSEERHTRQRDVILRLCIAGRLTTDETQRALKLYGMSPLYAKIPRDAVIMVALNQRMDDVHEVDALLISNRMKALEKCGAGD